MKDYGRIHIRLGKKASLSLSINAIVVLILAITMLGLGLAFMRGMFGKVTGQLGEITEEIKAEVIKKVEQSSAKLTFLDKKITIKRSEKKELFFGVKNQLNEPAIFSFEVDCYDALGVEDRSYIDEFIAFDKPTDTVKEVPIGDVKVLALRVIADPNAQITTYTCEIAAATDEGTLSISDKGVEVDPPDAEYAREQFFVTVE